MMDGDSWQQQNEEERQKRLRRDWALTPEERMEKFFRLQAAAWEVLQSNPEAMAEFHRRNHKKRTQARVKELTELLMRSPKESDPT